MKKLILGLALLASMSSFADDFTSDYEDFAFKGAYELKDIFIGKATGRIPSKKVKGVSFKVDGEVASCSGLSFREYFPEFKVAVKSCSPQELKVSIQYLRVASCAKKIAHDGKRVEVKLPKNCAFSSKSGDVSIVTK